MTPYPGEGEGGPAALLRWGLAGLCVAALHAGAGWWIVTHPITPAAPPDTVQGIPIDLEPVAVPASAPIAEPAPAGGAAPNPQGAAAPEPQAEPAVPDPTPNPVPPPEPPPPAPAEAMPPPPVAETPPPEPPLLPEPQSAQTAPVTEPPHEATPVPAAEPPPVVLPRNDTRSDAVLAPPPKPKATKPDPRALARDVAHREALAEQREQQRVARAQARQEARAAAQVRARQVQEAGGQGPSERPPGSVSSGAALATWRGAVQARLRAFTPSGDGATGTARVAFTVDGEGRVAAASLAGSSGDPALDAAAVAMVRRASPFPAPPPEFGGRVGLTVPVHFQ